MKLSVVIAAYDEVANIEPLFRRLERTLASMPEVDLEAIFVVEGRDGTREALERLSAHLSWVRILYDETPSGLGAAFRRGFAAVSDDAEYVVTLDADLNHQPEEIPLLLAAARSRDCDVLVGSRFVAGSEVEGSPIWKRALSGGVNALMHWLYDLDVSDKTSGFRIYRARVLKELSFCNRAFAFLPEILILARRAGYRVAEEPIRFTFRREGRSKMYFWDTSWSYLELLWRRFDRWSWTVAALFFLGLLLRLAVTFPIHKCPADADCILTGLCAFKVLRGETPVFFSYFRIGSLGAHLTALLFLIGGVSRTTLSLGPVIFGTLTMVVWFLLCRSLFDRRTAAVAFLFIAVPSPAFLFWLYMPNGYPELMLSCATVLWLAARTLRFPHSRPLYFALGLSAGVGLWCSLLSLGCSAPAYLWLLSQRPRAVLRRSALVLSVGGFALGAAPWLVFNLRYGFPSLFSNFAAETAAGIEGVVSNAAYLVTYKIPELISSVDDRFRPVASARLSWMEAPLLGLHAAAVIVFVYLVWRGRASRAEIHVEKSALLIFALVFVFMSSFNVFSAAGTIRGPTVRYLLPLYLIVPGLLAPPVRWVASRSRIVAAALSGSVLFFNLSASYLPWTAERQRWRQAAANDDRLFELLEREDVDAVIGDYWQVYPINFYTRERVRAVPWIPQHDHYQIMRELDGKKLRWAVLTLVDYRRVLPIWTAGFEGRIIEADRNRLLFLVREPELSREFVERIRKVRGEVR
jgi:dolichol-phosphate mannosyltransferase